MKFNIKVDTTKYEAVHGKKPKGFGLWMFENRDSSEKWNFSFTGTYAEAKKAAVQAAMEVAPMWLFYEIRVLG